MDFMTESMLIGCMNMKTASHTGMLVYLLLLSRLRIYALVDHSVLVQIDKEKVYCRAGLKRVVASSNSCAKKVCRCVGEMKYLDLLKMEIF